MPPRQSGISPTKLVNSSVNSLNIYMKNTSLTLAIVAILISSLGGCTSSEILDIEFSKPIYKALGDVPFELMTFVYVDFNECQNEGNLYDVFECDELMTSVEDSVSPLGLSIDQIDYMVSIGLPDRSPATLMYGEIDTKLVQSALAELNLNNGKYNSIESFE